MVVRSIIFDNVRQEIPGPRHEASIMVFAFPWLWGLPCAIAGAGPARWGGYRFCAIVVMRRAALRLVRVGGGCAFGSLCCARGPWAQLSIIVRAPRGGLVGRRRRRALQSVVGDWDVCGRDGGVLGANVDNLGEAVCSLPDDVSEHGESSLGANPAVLAV